MSSDTGTPWRHPAEESVDLYPGLTVCDNRVTGSITVGRTRLPLWAFVQAAVVRGWDDVEAGYSPSEYGMTANDLGRFLYDLLECRGEFGRLLLVLANAERTEKYGKPWWRSKKRRKVVADQLRRCLDVLEAAEAKRA